MGAGSRVHEEAVRDAIGGGDLDVLLGDRLRIGCPRQQRGEPGPRRQCAELTPGQFIFAVQILAGFPECSIVAHDLLLVVLMAVFPGQSLHRSSGQVPIGARDRIRAATHPRSGRRHSDDLDLDKPLDGRAIRTTLNRQSRTDNVSTRAVRDRSRRAMRRLRRKRRCRHLRLPPSQWPCHRPLR